MYQQKVSTDWGKQFSIPIYYFTELIGLACDLKGVKHWFSRHITNPSALLQELDLWKN